MHENHCHDIFQRFPPIQMVEHERAMMLRSRFVFDVAFHVSDAPPNPRSSSLRQLLVIWYWHQGHYPRRDDCTKFWFHAHFTYSFFAGSFRVLDALTPRGSSNFLDQAGRSSGNFQSRLWSNESSSTYGFCTEVKGKLLLGYFPV